MIGVLRHLFADTIVAKGLTVSATIHLLGLGALAFLGSFYDFMPAPSGDVAFHITLEIQEADPTLERSVASVSAAPPTVLVTPDRVRVDQRWYRRVPSNVNPPNVEQLQVTEPIVLQQALTADVERSYSADEPQQAIPSREVVIEKTPAEAPSVVAPTEVATETVQEQAARNSASARIAGYGDAPPQFTYQPSPVYPQVARSRRIEGTVLLGLEIAVSGQVTDVRVLRSSGSTALDGAAVRAVRTWRCVPRQRAGISVASSETLPVYFRLR